MDLETVFDIYFLKLSHSNSAIGGSVFCSVCNLYENETDKYALQIKIEVYCLNWTRFVNIFNVYFHVFRVQF